MNQGPTHAQERTRDLRERMLARLLDVTAVMGVVAYIPSAYLSIVTSLWVILIVDTIALLYVICLSRIPQLPYRMKLISILVINYLLGLFLLIFTGPFGAGHLFIFCFVFLVSLFGGLRAMILGNVLAILTHVGFAVASSFHWLPWLQNRDSIIVISANFVLVSFILSFAANYLIRGYAASATEEKRLRIALETMLHEMEHRVKNNLQVISSLINLRSRPPADPARVLADIKEILIALNIVHRLLYRHKSVFVIELKSLLTSLVESFRGLHRPITFDFQWTGSDVEIESDRATSFGLIINEIVMNAVKHAFPDGRGKISISVDFEPRTRRLWLFVGDDGRGMVADQKNSGSGLGIIQALAHQLSAKTTIKNSPGVSYRFEMILDDPQFQILMSSSLNR